MSLVQLLVEKDTKAAALSALLDREGFSVVRPAQPDFALAGAIVADRQALERSPALLDYPERVVLIAPNRDPRFLSMLWQHEMKSVVFEADPPGTVLLAVLGLSIGSGSGTAPARPNLVVLGSR
jgi:hypothetical protein